MKSFLIMSLLVFSFQIQAQESAAPTAVSPSASSEDLQKSFQKEYVYLASQKAALSQQKNRLQQGFAQRITTAKVQTTALQKELVQLSGDNDDNHEYLSNLERRKKELQKRGSSMETTYKKATKSLAEFQAGLHFESQNQKMDVNAPEDLKFEDFEALINKSAQVLESAAGVETFQSSFIDMDGKLVEGSITRIGRSAAIGTVQGQHFVLGPNGEGMLKALEASQEPNQPSLNLYVFESLSKMAQMRKPGGWTEKLADLSPILFLATMLLLVLGLFVSLIKV